MIIERSDRDLVLIRQPDHAALAARIMAAWQDEDLPANPRRDAILTATRAHDDGWMVEDAAPRVDGEGRPRDFITVDLAVKQGVWPRVVDSLAVDQPYAAALVAQHALTVYTDSRTKPEWLDFFDGMAARRHRLLATCGAAADAAIDSDYRFVRMGDILSLIFCGGWRQPYDHDGRRIEQHGDVLTVSPDPFAGRTVELALETRRIAATPYASDAELQAALAAAPLEWRRGTAAGRA